MRSKGWVRPKCTVQALLSLTCAQTILSLEMSSMAPAPSNLPEQRAIAAFLDRETAQIDALVAKKERLIELLQEKRTSLISHAVTKGLDPDVPLKDSGVEWLGEIPAHWEVKQAACYGRLRSNAVSRSWERDMIHARISLRAARYFVG